MAAPLAAPKISIIVISLNEGYFLRNTIEQLLLHLPDAAEIIVVDDGSEDGSADFLIAENNPSVRLFRTDQVGIAKARNYGARQSRGEVIVFSDAHVRVPGGWCKAMLEVLSNPAVGAVGPVLADMTEPECKGYGVRFAGPDLQLEWLPPEAGAPHPIPLLPGGFCAVRREIFDAVGGFDEGMIRWGSEDLEFSLRLWLRGYELWITPQVEVEHLFRDTSPYYIAGSWAIYNRLRVAFAHFDTPRLTRVVNALCDQPDFDTALALTVQSDLTVRRAALADARLHDAEWFFNKFGPVW
jgi:GT2 family glycosyltransferase